MHSGMRWFSTLIGVSILALGALSQQGGIAGRTWRLTGPMQGVWELPHTQQGKGFLAGSVDALGGGALYAFDALLIDVGSPCLSCIEGTITGTLDAEYKQDEFYTPFVANTATSLLLRFEGSAITGSGENNTLEILIPEVRFKKVTPQVSGPDIVQASVEFEVYSDETNNPLQVYIISEDSAAL